MYSPEQTRIVHDRLILSGDLLPAVERGELFLEYQPIVDLPTGRVEEFEALVRWQHPVLGRIPPDRFISLAEETGAIVAIGRWVLTEACRQAVIWNKASPGGPSVTMAVNLSPRQFQHPDLVADIAEALRESGLPPEQLKLEITESVALGDPEMVIATMWLLRGMGIRLAVDDFGTGYSSLGSLKRFPVETLKIDRVFVTGLAMQAEDAAIIRAVVTFAREMGLRTTAEGIETTEQAQLLTDLGCDHGQGYLFARPLRAEAAGELLRAPETNLKIGKRDVCQPDATRGNIAA